MPEYKGKKYSYDEKGIAKWAKAKAGAKALAIAKKRREARKVVYDTVDQTGGGGGE